MAGILDVHFEITVAASGIIAPKLYAHLREAQDEQRSNKAILLTDMSFGYSNGLSTAYESLSHDELDLGSDDSNRIGRRPRPCLGANL